ncbi:MAG: GntR family transcriptional regulator [Defluviitaleaceae bacterium]|nr:GntR family transcriptional regulator [Defluviitaleaceae bacterium]
MHVNQIDKGSRIPAYVQMMNALIKQIQNGTFNQEDQLPSERELCAIYGVSRSTVRQAIQEMENDGYVNTYKGKGTFVASNRLSQEMSGLYSFTEYMKKSGKTISTKLVNFTKIKCDERISQKMKCDVGVDIIRFTRVRYVDQEPVIIVTTNLLQERFPDFKGELLSANSLYTMMSDSYNVIFSKVKETLQSVPARKNESALLQLKLNAPCMKIDRYTYENDTIIEYGVGIARGDKYQYNVELH